MSGGWILTIVFCAMVVIGIVMISVYNKRWQIVDEVVGVIGMIALVIGGVFGFFFMIGTVVSENEARTEYEAFLEMKEYIESTYEYGNNHYDDIIITDTVIQQNLWLMAAKGSKNALGIWSAYYYIDLSDVEPIVLKEKGG